ncbi:MAG TPA: hypothetical protein VLI91_14220, partial [Roseiarcus sp.]|nr:hypothetical protein [Roseiarcus sp.]
DLHQHIKPSLVIPFSDLSPLFRNEGEINPKAPHSMHEMNRSKSTAYRGLSNLHAAIPPRQLWISHLAPLAGDSGVTTVIS